MCFCGFKCSQENGHFSEVVPSYSEMMKILVGSFYCLFFFVVKIKLVIMLAILRVCENQIWKLLDGLVLEVLSAFPFCVSESSPPPPPPPSCPLWHPWLWASIAAQASHQSLLIWSHPHFEPSRLNLFLDDTFPGRSI